MTGANGELSPTNRLIGKQEQQHEEQLADIMGSFSQKDDYQSLLRFTERATELWVRKFGHLTLEEFISPIVSEWINAGNKLGGKTVSIYQMVQMVGRLCTGVSLNDRDVYTPGLAMVATLMTETGNQSRAAIFANVLLNFVQELGNDTVRMQIVTRYLFCSTPDSTISKYWKQSIVGVATLLKVPPNELITEIENSGVLQLLFQSPRT